MGRITNSTRHPIFKSALVAMLVARIQKAGKKSVAERLIFKTMQFIERKTGKPALIVLEMAIRRLMPDTSLASQRVGASVYQIPRSILTSNSVPLCIKWILDGAKSKKSKNIYEAVGLEIIDAFNGQGVAVTKLQQNKRMATANLVYAHLGKGQYNRASRVGRKIFKSRLGSKQQKVVRRLSKIKKQYRQVDHSVDKNYDFYGDYRDQVWYPAW